MISPHQKTADILEKIESFPGVNVGIAAIADVLNGLSYQGSSVKKVIASLQDDTITAKRLPEARWVLVLGLHHPEHAPEMDWWQGNNTPGNRQLMEITAHMAEWLLKELDLEAQSLPYHVEKGGLFQKDAAVLSGIGIVGRSNLLLHPDWGPRIRFRSMLVTGELDPTQPIKDFDPCTVCGRPCQDACPQQAFAEGTYIRDRCLRQMQADEAGAVPRPQEADSGRAIPMVKYCRACEIACPIGLPGYHMRSV